MGAIVQEQVTFKFFAAGIPATKGSTRSFALKKGGVFTGRVATVNDSARTKPWMGVVATAAHEAGVTPLSGPVALSAHFFLPRAKGHFGSGKNASVLRASSPKRPTERKSDLDKLARCVLDALLGVAFADDGQVVELHATKSYSSAKKPPGVSVLLERADWEVQL